mgnify:CR=1 FL=1
MEQLWRGVKVYDSGLVAEQENSGLILADTIDGKYIDGIEDDVESPTPDISESRAIELARAFNGDNDKEIENVSSNVLLSYLLEFD